MLKIDRNFIIKKLKEYMSPDFNRVFSNSFFENVILPMYEDNHFSKYVVAFLDANSLGKINTQYGMDYGDRALSNSLSEILEILPDDAVVIRRAGDEFIIIFNEYSLEDAKDYLMQINPTLLSSTNEHLTFTIGVSDSNNFGSFKDTISNATQKEMEYKMMYCPDIDYDKVSTLYGKILHGLDYAFSAYRLKGLGIEDIDSIKNKLLNSDFSFNCEGNNNSMPIAPLLGIKPEDARRIFYYLTKGEGNIDNIPKNVLKDLVTSICINPNTKLPIKKYLFSQLPDLANKIEDYQALLISCSGLKVSNIIHGYEATDYNLKKIAYNIPSAILHGSDIKSTSRPSLYMSDWNSGNFVALVRSKKPINTDLISYNLNQLYLPSDVFNIVSSSAPMTRKQLVKENFVGFVRELLEENNLKKEDFKKNSIKSGNSDNIFRACLLDSFSYFVSDVQPNEPDISLYRNLINKAINEISTKYIDRRKEPEEDEL